MPFGIMIRPVRNNDFRDSPIFIHCIIFEMNTLVLLTSAFSF